MGTINTAVNVYFLYKFLTLLVTPWEKMDAYKYGIIDRNGKILRRSNTLKTQDEKDSYTIFHRFVWKIKRLLNLLPFGRTKIASYAAALWFLKEEPYYDEIANGLKKVLKEHKISTKTTIYENIHINMCSGTVKKNFTDLDETIILPVGTQIKVISKNRTILGVPFYNIVAEGKRFVVPVDVISEEDGATGGDAATSEPTTSASSGAIAGLDDNPPSHVLPKAKKPLMFRRFITKNPNKKKV